VPLRAVLAVVALLLVLVVAFLPSPYAIERPGPVFDTLGTTEIGGVRTPLISVPGRRTYPTTGSLDLLTVSVLGAPSGGPPWLDLLAAWADPAQAVVPLAEIYPPGQTQRQADREGVAQMNDSQRSAIAAALTHLGYAVRGTVRVEEVEPRTAAAGVLRPGDVVRRYAGTDVHDACGLQDLVLAHGTRPAALSFERAGAARTVTVTPRRVPAGDTTRPLLGVVTSASYTFPFPVRLRISDVGGPSAGMMFALGIVDELTPGSLTGGRTIAGTGTICGDGTVGPIGGIVQKMAAARRAGATVFLAPDGNCDEVAGHIPQGLSVYSVKSLSGALDVLKTLTSARSRAGLATCRSSVGSSG
jgi:PDZ domain-containing protein